MHKVHGSQSPWRGAAFLLASRALGRFVAAAASVVPPRPHAAHCPPTLRTHTHTVSGYIKLALPAGKANPAPPVGPALGAKVKK